MPTRASTCSRITCLGTATHHSMAAGCIADIGNMRMPVALGKTVHSLRLLSPYINCPYQGRRPSCRAASHVCRAATPDAPSHGTQPSVVDRPPQISGSAEQSVASTSYDEAEDTFRTMQLILPEPENTKVKTATFIKSSVTTQDCPPEKHPEFAVIGRSNVGKSSLINMLTGRKDLALVSKQPGMDPAVPIQPTAMLETKNLDCWTTSSLQLLRLPA